MSNTSLLQALEYEAETNFGEDVVTFATHRLPICAPIDLSGIKHMKLDSGRLVQRLQEMTEWILGPQEGSFKIKLWAAGHGSTTIGSPTVDPMETFKGYIFGNPTGGAEKNATLSGAASTTCGAGSTTTVLVTVASGTLTAGSLVRVGVKGDGRGDGQLYPVVSHVGTSLTLLLATLTAANAADVIAPCVNFWTPEDATSAATVFPGLRFRVRTANAGVELHGCFPTDVTLAGLNTGELPYWEITFGVSWWRYTATSGVSAVAQNQYNPAPIAQGSFHVGAVGSSARATRTVRNVTIAIKLGMVPLDAPGGVNPYQKITGAKRVPSMVTLKFMIDFDAATATPTLDTLFTAGAPLMVMVTSSTTPGSMFGFHMPNARVTGARPMQTANDNINRYEIELSAGTGTTTTTDQTCSAFRAAYC